jgi:hypothetical protein
MKLNYPLSFGLALINEINAKQGKIILGFGVLEKRIDFCLNGLGKGYGYTYTGIGAFEDNRQQIRVKFVPIEEGNCEWEILNEKQREDK